MDCLRFVIEKLQVYQPIVPVLVHALQQSNANKIIDLCSGAGGAMEQLAPQLNAQIVGLHIQLSDKFPNINAFQLLATKSNGVISYIEYPIDAAKVPEHVQGFRCIFSAFHHFKRPFAKAVLNNALEAKTGIAVFDGGDKNIFIIIALIVAYPFIFFFCTPFLKPFRFSRLLFTYIIPIIPLCQIWDGFVSILRLYTPAQLLAIAHELQAENYVWEAGKVRNKFGFAVAYLIGYPKNSQL